MSLIFADRVKETTTSTGTGPLTLAGAVAGFEPFSSVCADGDTAYYCVTDGTSWEVGLGTYAAGVLTRTSVLSSSAAGAAVSLNPGSKDVFLTVPAQVIEAANTAVVPIGALPPGVDGRLVYASDLHYAAFVYDSAGPGGADYYLQGAPGAVMSGAGAPAATDYPGGTLAVAHTAGNVTFVFNGSAWSAIGATDATARSTISEIESDIASLIALVTFYGPFAGFPVSATSGQLAIASDQSNTLYSWTGSTWAVVTADGVDATARASANSALALATTAQPAIAPGDPTTAGAPTDGSLVYYFDNSTTPYTMWVWDGVWAQVQ